MTQITCNTGAMSLSDDAAQNPELELMTRLRNGDSMAMNELVRRHGPVLNRLVGRLTGWSADSDDILQEVFLNAWQKAAQFRGRGSLEGWLRRLAVNRCRNHHRARNAFKQLMSRVASRSAQATMAEPAESGKLSALRHAMAKLNNTDRAVLVLYYLEELGGEEVAELMNVRVDTVHMRLHRARARLREIVQADDQSHGKR